MLRLGLVAHLSAALERRSLELLILVLRFLKKLSIFRDNVDTMLELETVEKLCTAAVSANWMCWVLGVGGMGCYVGGRKERRGMGGRLPVFHRDACFPSVRSNTRSTPITNPPSLPPIPLLGALLGASNEDALHTALGLMFNLAFDGRARAEMVRFGAIPRLGSLIDHPSLTILVTRVLYLISQEDKHKSVFTFSNLVPTVGVLVP